jgi:hypothetical protein
MRREKFVGILDSAGVNPRHDERNAIGLELSFFCMVTLNWSGQIAFPYSTEPGAAPVGGIKSLMPVKRIVDAQPNFYMWQQNEWINMSREPANTSALQRNRKLNVVSPSWPATTTQPKQNRDVRPRVLYGGSKCR